MTRLDEALFEPSSGWFVIDAHNQRVPQVVITSLRQGLDLVGRGTVATVVGRLVEGVRAVDVDLGGHRGHAVVEEVAAWCRTRGLWHLVRPSGGADGRTHVLVAAGGHQDDLQALLGELRATWRASRTTIDLRSTLRPLSAPHRTEGWTRPLGSLGTALTSLRRTLPAMAPAAADKGRGRRTGEDLSAGSGPLLPRRRRARRELPAQWEAYLLQGHRPAIAADQPGGRSNHEALATSHLLWAGHDADSAWARITGAHPGAFTKARSKGRAWWARHVWDAAVRADDDFVGRTDPPDVLVMAAVAQARHRLTEAAWRLSERTRPCFLVVGHTVLDRMERTGQTRVPVPERDLVLDTAITDRRTLREHLARLERAGVLLVHRDTLDPAARATTSYEAEAPPPPEPPAGPQVGGVGQIPPPSLHTPLPERLPEGCPAYTWLVARALTETPSPTADLATAAHLSPIGDLTAGQARTLRTALTVLSRIGLARCDEHGRWRRGPGLTTDATRAADRRQQHLRHSVETERAAYRQGRGSTWSTQRALAVKQQRAREVAWWRGLSPTGRSDRRRTWTHRFAAASVHEQHRVKTDLVARELRRGQDPVRRHQRWVAENADDQRRLERAEAYSRLPHPLQVALARAWAEHRAEHGIPRDLLPGGRLEHELATVGPQRSLIEETGTPGRTATGTGQTA